MNVLTHSNSLVLWEEVISDAEKECSVKLERALEAYLASLLHRYTDKPALVKAILATSFLEAMQQQSHQRQHSLQQVGDQCLLLTGLFPKIADKRHVKIRYFVDLGRAAYTAISTASANDLYHSLAIKFVLLMDILQSIRHYNDLLPLEAYEQWQELGSQRAFKILQSYTSGTPFKTDDSLLK